MPESIDTLTQQVATLKAELASKEESLKQMQVQQQAMEDSMAALQLTLAELEENINALASQPQEAAAAAAAVEAAEPAAIISDAPYPQEKLDGFVGLKVLEEEREHLLPYAQMIRDSEFFDAAWYLEQYPDTQDSDLAGDPAMHYLLFGGFEGRHPGPSFNSVAYFIENPDVYKNQTNPLLHFMLFGLYEERIVYKVAE